MGFSQRYLSLAIVAACTAFPSPALANTIVVATTVDSLSNDGLCSFREAIINANNDAATWPDCTAGAGADIINLPAGTITIAIANTPGPPDQPANQDLDQVAEKGDFDILSSMTINGHASGTTINGAQLDRIFDINPDVDGLPETLTAVITVHINRLTMTNARQNQSGAVRILARATVTMDRCTVSNSESWADDGGGIFIHGDGGLPPQPGSLTLTNSTISGNHALIIGGGIRSDGGLTIVNSTITDNDTGAVFGNLGQGLMCGTPCTLRNSIVAGNGAAPRGDIQGEITSLGYNIIGKTTNNAGDVIALITPTVGDQFDTGVAFVELQPLANNGGPTPTHVLGAASIAIDQGESSGLSTDQRGETRPCDLAAVTNAAGGDGADIGAFEVQGACSSGAPPDAVDDTATVEVNSGANTVDVLANDTDPDLDPLSITAVTQGTNGGVVSTDGATVSYAPGLNFLGTDTFTYTVDDGHGGTDTATVTVTVEDTAPPQLTASVGMGSLWPPNHQLEDVGLTVTASDNGGVVTTAVSVFSDEDDLAPGSGNFSPDAKNVAPSTLRLRAERSGAGDGRVYLISVVAADSSGNASAACVTVVVPQNNSPQARAAVAAQAAAAKAYCEANTGAAPAGSFVVGDGPVQGPKQ